MVVHSVEVMVVVHSVEVMVVVHSVEVVVHSVEVMGWWCTRWR